MKIYELALFAIEIATANDARIVPQKPLTSTNVPIVESKCDVKPYKYLVGRSITDVLSAKLPKNTRIYKIGDTPNFGESGKNRLNIELSNRTIVRRVYCS